MRKRGVIKRQCSKCDGPLEDHRVGVHCYCLKCHAWYMRSTRPKHRDLPPLARKKANARAYAHVYFSKYGKIEKKPCSVCGSEDSQMHHEDYDKPLEVTWMCRPCHLIYHKHQKNAAVKPSPDTDRLSKPAKRTETARGQTGRKAVVHQGSR